MEMSAAAMITLSDISKRFAGGVQALKRTSMAFSKGQFTVLLGPSGAGKSTLLRCLNFLNIPSTGCIAVDGLGVLNGNRSLLRTHRHQTAMVFQQHQLIGRYSALKNVLIGRIANYGAWRSLWPLPHREMILALECLDRVGLLEKAAERVDNLSGGQQQRVGIARGLAQQPRTILADEPVASLDPATSEKILGLLHRICREDRLTAIVSLHQVDLAKMFADRVIGLSGGAVVFDGATEEITDEVYQRIYNGRDIPLDNPAGMPN
jgi:phosphonate transport system ATP-binding protein